MSLSWLHEKCVGVYSAAAAIVAYISSFEFWDFSRSLVSIFHYYRYNLNTYDSQRVNIRFSLWGKSSNVDNIFQEFVYTFSRVKYPQILYILE